MKKFIVTLPLFLFLIVFPSYELRENTLSVNIYKEDYIEACTLISKNYIYLERKLNKTRDEFLKECINYADSIHWSNDKSQFIDEIRKLTSKLADGHVSWSIPEELYLDQGSKFLGFVLTIGNDEKVYVGKTYPDITDKLSIGDEIIKWNGEDIKKEIEAIGNLIPHSTKYATNEIAARSLTIEYSFHPLRKELKPITISYKNKQGLICESTFQWKSYSATLQWQNLVMDKTNDNDVILLAPSLYPSLEDIPSDAKYVHSSLLFYSRDINSKKCVIFHPRDFCTWNAVDLEDTFGCILNENPDTIIIDLKDSAGGSFDQVLYLSYALNIQKEFNFFFDSINSNTGIRTTGVDNFNFITDKINFKNQWKGEVFFRINPLVASGGDFFIRWMQLSKRGIIFGLPSAGAGGGTDTFMLKNTKTKINLPLRERIILGDTKPIEGNSIIPDYMYDGNIMDFFKDNQSKIWKEGFY